MRRAERFLIVSLGSIGKRHLRNLRRLRPESRIAALRRSPPVDANDATGCDEILHSFEDLRSFMPDAAIIANPAPFHVDVAARLLAMGVPVLVEKPLSDRIEGTDGLVRLASSKGIPAMVGYNLRFDPAVRHVHSMLVRQEVGEVFLARASVGQYLPDWRPEQDYRRSVSASRALGGGPLLELSHELDLLYWFFGMPDAVFCRGGKYSALEIEVEDAVELILEYVEPKRLVSVGLNFLQRGPKRTCTVIGSRGTLTWDGVDRRVSLERPGTGTAETDVVSFAGVDRNEMYIAELEHFLTCVETGATPTISIRDGLAVLAIVEAAAESMRKGTSVRPRRIC